MYSFRQRILLLNEGLSPILCCLDVFSIPLYDHVGASQCGCSGPDSQAWSKQLLESKAEGYVVEWFLGGLALLSKNFRYDGSVGLWARSHTDLCEALGQDNSLLPSTLYK